jgi:large subunit ribosomal protein L25
MEKIKFTVFKRQNKKNNQLRREGIVPANMYQAGQDSLSLEINNIAFLKLSRNLGENAVIYLQLEGEKNLFPVLIDDVQYDVFGKKVLHVVFRKINLTEKIKAQISVELTGEFDVENGVLVLVKDSIEVEALPTDLPEKFEIDQSKLTAIGNQVALSSLNFDKDKVTLVLSDGENPDETIIALVQEKAEEVEEVIETEAELVEPEVVGEKEAGEEPKQEADTKS